MFYDLRQPWLDDTFDTRERLFTSIRLGYTCIAYEHLIARKDDLAANCPIEAVDLESMIRVSDLDKECCLNLTSEDKSRVQQLKRLTVATSDPNDAQFLLHLSRNTHLRMYDVIACLPRSTEVLKLACESMEVDLISLDASEGLKVKKSWLKSALGRGVSLELSYCPDMHLVGSVRQHFCSFVKRHCDLTRAKSTTLSSGSTEGKQLRSPYDVINLAQYLGFSPKQAMASLKEHCQGVIEHGKLRRLKTEAIIPWIQQNPNKEEQHRTKRPKITKHSLKQTHF